MVGEVFGTKVVVKTATTQNPLVEQRITHLVFTFNDRKDQIIVAGVADYPVAGSEFGTDQPVVGRSSGARAYSSGQAVN